MFTNRQNKKYRNKISRAQPPSKLLKQGKKELIHMTDKRPDQTLFYVWSVLQNSDHKPAFLAFEYRLLRLTHEAAWILELNRSTFPIHLLNRFPWFLVCTIHVKCLQFLMFWSIFIGLLCSCYVVLIGLLCTTLKPWSLSKVEAHLSSHMTWGVIYVWNRNAVVWVTHWSLIVRMKGHMIQVWATIIVMLHSQHPWSDEYN